MNKLLAYVSRKLTGFNQAATKRLGLFCKQVTPSRKQAVLKQTAPSHIEPAMLSALFVALMLTLTLCACPASLWADDPQNQTDQQAQTDQEQSSQEDSGQEEPSQEKQGSDDGESLSNKVYVNQLSDSSFLYETSIADLAEADSYYEGQTVLVKGEVVGDRVNDEFRKNNCWITLQDSETSPSVVSVFMTMDQSSIIDTYGQYGTVGTQLQIRGTFHLECAEHQGLSDIHAEEVSAIQKGYESTPAPNMRILSIAIVACVLGAILMIAYHIKRERML